MNGVETSESGRQGYVYKYISLQKGYKRRWINIDAGFLSWYAQAEDSVQHCLGLVNLRYARLKQSSEGRKWTIEDCSGKRMKHYFKVDSAEQGKAWLKAISKNLGNLPASNPASALPSTTASPDPALLSPPMLNKRRQFFFHSSSKGTSPEVSPFQSHSPSFGPSVVSLLSNANGMGVEGDSMSRDGTEDAFQAQAQNLTVASDRIMTALKSMHSGLDSKESSLGEQIKQVEEMCADLKTQSLFILNLLNARLQDEIVARKLYQDGVVQLATDDQNGNGDKLDYVKEAPETEVEEEFFDALEPVVDNSDSNWAREHLKMPGFEAYQFPRKKLPIENDQRPSTSLWAVLKNAIGKDLTKISLPVGFNEPLSGLQRACEDLEYSACLDRAAICADPMKRLLHVTAFAFSAYASSQGRTAKPFNPLLGETFELIKPDQGFRVITEQVSHHPPIGAVFAESEKWNMKSEIASKARFTGTSVEINLCGLCHVELSLPDIMAHDKPANAYKVVDGKVAENYTFDRATCIVSNVILGTPSLDYTGPVTISCHQTGQKVVLTYKPNAGGWRQRLRSDSSVPHEVNGMAYDADGVAIYKLQGTWDSYLRAEPVSDFGAGAGEGKNGFMLWKVTDREVIPFNFTPYAVTLNDISPGLLQHLPPTDARRRPDQRAFESAQFELADDLKFAQEEKQRLTRKQRQEGAKSAWSGPTWFTASESDAAGRRKWEPILSKESDATTEYWARRRAAAADAWHDIEPIFTE